jgi:hypothetical protein
VHVIGMMSPLRGRARCPLSLSAYRIPISKVEARCSVLHRAVLHSYDAGLRSIHAPAICPLLQGRTD